MTYTLCFFFKRGDEGKAQLKRISRVFNKFPVRYKKCEIKTKINALKAYRVCHDTKFFVKFFDLSMEKTDYLRFFSELLCLLKKMQIPENPVYIILTNGFYPKDDMSSCFYGDYEQFLVDFRGGYYLPYVCPCTIRTTHKSFSKSFLFEKIFDKN